MSQQGVAELPPVRPRRAITGMSAILLPFVADGAIDWAAFEAHVVRTAEAGLVPAVNMDTGYVQLLDERTVTEVLDRTAALTGGRFVAGAFVPDSPGDPHDDAALLAPPRRSAAVTARQWCSRRTGSAR